MVELERFDWPSFKGQSFNALVLGPWSGAETKDAHEQTAGAASIIIREFTDRHDGIVLGFYASQDSCLPEVRPACFMHSRSNLGSVHQALCDIYRPGRGPTLFLVDDTGNPEPCYQLLARGRDVEASSVTLADELPKETMTTHQDFVFVWLNGVWSEQAAASVFWRRFAPDLGPKFQDFDDFWALWSCLASVRGLSCLVLSRVHPAGHGLFWWPVKRTPKAWSRSLGPLEKL
jgi:hypothetical protein